MKKILLIILFPIIAQAQCPQAPIISVLNTPQKIWDKAYGGNSADILTQSIKTADGGFILAGTSYSGISGDKTAALKGVGDYWLVKTNADGDKIWDKSYGGGSDDNLKVIIPTSDGGYLVGGFSASGISGDKTQVSQGSYDYWVVKIDEMGNILWDKTFGGASGDILNSILQLPDGGYILVGNSASQISGDKGQNSAFDDYWIIRIDAIGNKVWDKTYGGTFNDAAFSAIETIDNKYLIGGISSSGISGDKTQENVGAWLLKIDIAGEIIWDKTYELIGPNGTNLKMINSHDNNIFIAGDNYTTRQNDFSLIKINNYGDLLWSKSYGGNASEYLQTIIETSIGEIFLGGSTVSGIGGEKSEEKKSQSDYWVLKVNNLGDVIWDKSFGGSSSSYSFLTSIQIIDNDNLLLIGNTFSGIANDKTIASKGVEDFWVIKMAQNTSTTIYLCSSRSKTLKAGNCVGIISWSNGQTGYQIIVNPTISTTYTATCTENNCSSPGSNTLNISIQSVPTISASTNNLCVGESITLTASNTNSDPIIWSNNYNESQGISSLNFSPSTTSSGEYRVRKTNSATVCYSNVINVDYLPTPTLTSNTGSFRVCQSSGPLTLTASGCVGGTLTWKERYTYGCGFGSTCSDYREIGTGSSISLNVSNTYSYQCKIGNCISNLAGFGVEVQPTVPAPIVNILVDENCGNVIQKRADFSQIFNVTVRLTDNTYLSLEGKNVKVRTKFGDDIWSKSFVLENTPTPIKIIPQFDGNFILCYYTNAGLYGDKSEAGRGGQDFWIVKIDPFGNKIWDRRFGGTDNDYLSDVVQYSNGLLLIGTSYSPIGGDISSVNPNSNPSENTAQWLVSIDNNGNLNWESRFLDYKYQITNAFLLTNGNLFLGGNYNEFGFNYPSGSQLFGMSLNSSNELVSNIFLSGVIDYNNYTSSQLFKVLQANDGGLIFVSRSNTAAGNFKTENSRGGSDYWIVKTNEALNSVIWNKTIGSNATDIPSDAILLSDENIVIAGVSGSGISNEKTEANVGGSDFWIVKIDPSGSKIWDKTFGSTFNESNLKILVLNNQEFLIGGSVSNSTPSGNKTVNGLNWVIRASGCDTRSSLIFCSTQTNPISIEANGFAGNILWNNGFTTSSFNILPTTNLSYTAKCKVNGCESVSSPALVINHSNPPTIPTLSQTGSLTVCPNTTINLTASNCNGALLWSNSSTNSTINISSEGNYSATCTTGCGTSPASSSFILVSPNLSQSLSGNGINATIKAIKTISSTQNINNGFNSTYLAGKSITLNPNFVANGGAVFKAEIGNACPITNGLLLHLPFDGNANNISGGNNNGTVSNASLTSDRDGKPNSAYYFNGTNAFISVPNHPSFSGNDELTLSAWIRPEDLNGTYRGIITKWFQAVANDTYAILIDNANQFLASVNPNPPIRSSIISANNWIQVVYTHNTNSDKMFVNGILVATTNVTTGVASTSIPIIIGADNNNGSIWRFFKGKIDEVKIYNRALTIQEIEYQYAYESIPTNINTGLVASYNLDNNFADQSGNGHNATFANTTVTTGRKGDANGAYSFNGVNQRINLGTWFNLQEFTISMWVNTGSTQANAYAMIIDNNHGGNLMWNMQQRNTTLNLYDFGLSGSPGTGQTFNLTSNQWTHIVITCNGSTLSLYKNGILSGSSIYTRPIIYNGTQSICFGAYVNGGNYVRHWNGKMDDIKIYNRAVSDIEVSYLYSE